MEKKSKRTRRAQKSVREISGYIRRELFDNTNILQNLNDHFDKHNTLAEIYIHLLKFKNIASPLLRTNAIKNSFARKMKLEDVISRIQSPNEILSNCSNYDYIIRKIQEASYEFSNFIIDSHYPKTSVSAKPYSSKSNPVATNGYRTVTSNNEFYNTTYYNSISYSRVYITNNSGFKSGTFKEYKGLYSPSIMEAKNKFETLLKIKNQVGNSSLKSFASVKEVILKYYGSQLEADDLYIVYNKDTDSSHICVRVK